MWVIDFESSGLSKRSYPIEVAVSNGKIEFCALIERMNHWVYWNDESESVHNLSRENLQGNGVNPKEVALKLNDLIQGDKIYCDSIHWDAFWLNVLFSDNAIQPTFELADVLELLDTEYRLDTFLQSRQELISSGEFILHRALEDVRIIQKSLNKALDNAHIV